MKKIILILILIFLVACSTVEETPSKNVEIISRITSDDIEESEKEEIKPAFVEENKEIRVISRDTTIKEPAKLVTELEEPTESIESESKTERSIINLYEGQTVIINLFNKNYKLRFKGLLNNRTAKVELNEDTKLFTVGSNLTHEGIKFQTLEIIRNAYYDLPSDQVQLYLLTDKGLITTYLSDGQTKIIKAGDTTYELEAISISTFRNIPFAKLRINGKELKSMKEDEIEYISPKLQIYISDIFLNEKEIGKRNLLKFTFTLIPYYR